MASKPWSIVLNKLDVFRRIAKEEKETKVKWFGVYKELCHARDTNRELSASVVEDLKVGYITDVNE